MAAGFLHIGGTVRYLLWKASDIVPALKSRKAQDKMTMTEVVTALEELTLEDIGELESQHNIRVRTALVEPNDVLVVPCGWLMSELAVSGPLLYGVRKSFIFKSMQHRSDYEVIQGLYAHQGKNVEKMQLALKFMGD